MASFLLMSGESINPAKQSQADRENATMCAAGYLNIAQNQSGINLALYEPDVDCQTPVSSSAEVTPENSASEDFRTPLQFQLRRMYASRSNDTATEPATHL
jgi:hypothetical protein